MPPPVEASQQQGQGAEAGAGTSAVPPPPPAHVPGTKARRASLITMGFEGPDQVRTLHHKCMYCGLRQLQGTLAWCRVLMVHGAMADEAIKHIR